MSSYRVANGHASRSPRYTRPSRNQYSATGSRFRAGGAKRGHLPWFSRCAIALQFRSGLWYHFSASGLRDDPAKVSAVKVISRTSPGPAVSLTGPPAAPAGTSGTVACRYLCTRIFVVQCGYGNGTWKKILHSTLEASIRQSSPAIFTTVQNLLRRSLQPLETGQW